MWVMLMPVMTTAVKLSRAASSAIRLFRHSSSSFMWELSANYHTHKHTHRHIYLHTFTSTHRQTDTHTDRHINRHTVISTEAQTTHTWTYTHTHTHVITLGHHRHDIFRHLSLSLMSNFWCYDFILLLLQIVSTFLTKKERKLKWHKNCTVSAT